MSSSLQSASSALSATGQTQSSHAEEEITREFGNLAVSAQPGMFMSLFAFSVQHNMLIENCDPFMPGPTFAILTVYGLMFQ
jgi:hypothetical protein